MSMRWFSVAIVAALLLGGCLNYSMMPPVRTKVASGTFSIEPGRTWNKNTLNGDERWTLDGNSLQELIFINAGNGQRLNSTRLGGSAFGTSVMASKNDKLPPFSSAMTLLDIPEFIEASLTQLEAVDLYVTNFQAGKFGAADGFRFDIQFAYKSGLIAKGFVVGTTAGGRLVGMIFTAAETYYYARDLPEAERIIASIEFAGAVAPADTSLARAPVPMPTVGLLAVAAVPAPAVAAPAPAAAVAAPRPAVVPAPVAATALPFCSTVPLVQPPGTRNISGAVLMRDALLPVAAPVRAGPCTPDPPTEGTTVRDAANSIRDSLKPITAILPTPAAAPAPVVATPAPLPAFVPPAPQLPPSATAPAPVVATPAPRPTVVAPAPQPPAAARPAFVTAPIAATALPLCSTVPMVQPPGTRNIADATLMKDALLPVAAPVRAGPCTPDPPQGTTIRDLLNPGTAPRDSVKPITAIPR